MDKIKKVIKNCIKEVMAEPQSIDLIKNERIKDLEKETLKKNKTNKGVEQIDKLSPAG